jgi:protease-4
MFFGLLVLGVISILFWGGITFFISSIGFQKEKPDLFGAKNGIGVIELKGILVSSEETIADLTEFRDDDSIKAIVVRIDSPGGAVGASQEIFAEIKRTDEVKPVIASMASVAASGGYYAALGARRIMANPGTLTGSIGVILKFANLEEIFDKIGYKSEVIKSGRLKDIGSASRDMTQEEKDLLQALIDNVHSQFIKDVSSGRKLPVEDVVRLADGRIYSGEQALQLGLLDSLGNFTDAANLAAKLAGLDPTKTPSLIYPRQRNFSLYSLLTGEEGQAKLAGLFGHYPALVYEWNMFH